LLQRAASVRVIDEERTRILAELRKHMPDASDDEVNRTFEWSRQKALADATAQDEFAPEFRIFRARR
jgi:hypothetical protein